MNLTDGATVVAQVAAGYRRERNAFLRRLVKIRERHARNEVGGCAWCVGHDGARGGVPWPCPDYIDAVAGDKT